MPQFINQVLGQLGLENHPWVPFVILGLVLLLPLFWRAGHYFGKRDDDNWNKLSNARLELETTQKSLSKSNKELTKTRDEKASLSAENRKYNALKKSLLGNDEDLWLVHNTKPFDGFDAAMSSGDLEVITVMNLKGGVGKTTLASNLAAHMDVTLGKRVLVVDLDFQGSATTALLATSQIGVPNDVKIDHLFAKGPLSTSINDVQIPLTGSPLTRTSLAPCGYSFTSLENRMMVKWLLKETESDPRYLLAEYLFRENIRNNYDVVIIDAPPRLSLGAINALTCSQSLIIPTIPDRTSSEAVRNFVQQVNAIKQNLNNHLNRAFFTCNRSSAPSLSVAEGQMWDIVKGDDYAKAWNGMRHIVPTIIPRRAAFANATFNRSLAYFQNDTPNPSTPEILKSFGNDIASELNNL